VRRTRWAASLSLAFLLAVAPLLWAQTVAAGPSGDAQVDLNTASLAVFEKLPGVDQDTAKQIIAQRPYTSVADLTKSGPRASTIATITLHVKVGPLGTAASATGKGVAATASAANAVDR
jgi:DNA uptake protein ComE-like DNA-binding protein